MLYYTTLSRVTCLSFPNAKTMLYGVERVAMYSWILLETQL